MNVNRFASTAKLTRLIVALVFAGLATDPSAAQIQNRVCDTIPYDYIHNRIVIPVVLNGIPVRYIVDTGGQTGTVAEVAVKAGAEAQGYAGVSDLNSKKESSATSHFRHTIPSHNSPRSFCPRTDFSTSWESSAFWGVTPSPARS